MLAAVVRANKLPLKECAFTQILNMHYIFRHGERSGDPDQAEAYRSVPEQTGLYSSVVCPGLVMTNLTYGIMPSLFWTLIMPIMWLIRMFTNSFTISSSNGAEALVWLFNQNPESLDPLAKYHSCTSGFGRNYVKPLKMDLDDASSLSFYGKLLDLEKQLRKRFVPGNC